MLQAVANSILLKIGNIWLKKPSEIFSVSATHSPASKLNPADMVQIVGEVFSVPKMITTNRLGYQGYTTNNIRKGDTAIFRYDVIYSFAKDNKSWKNLFWFKGKEYWAADIVKVFAVIRDEKIIMLNGYCMVEDLKPKISLIIPGTIKDVDNITWGTLTHIGENLEGYEKIKAQPGDRVYFDPMVMQSYEIDKKPFHIVQQNNILGFDIADFNTLLAVK